MPEKPIEEKGKNELVRDPKLDEARKEVCFLCKFYDLKTSAAGLCRRHAPMVIPQNAQWPSVLKMDWCGEFQPQA